MPTGERAGTPVAMAPSRRSFLLGTALSAVAWMGARDSALADVAVNGARKDPHGDILVTVFMRGGADALNLVAPCFEDAYHRHRPTLALPAPNDRRAAANSRALDLDGRFGLNPVMAPLLPLFKEGRLGIVHACGSGDQTRSHFEAMSAMERGIPSQESGAASGWLGRHLSVTQPEVPSPLRAVAFSSIMPDALRGATDATALNSLNDFRLVVPGGGSREAELHALLTDIYQDGKDAMAQAGRETLKVLQTLNRLDPEKYQPANGVVYPVSNFGRALRQVACLIRSNCGLECAAVNHQGPYLWDTHVAQNTVFAAQAGDLAGGIAAFVNDMGPEMKRITVVVMTEFGRALRENTGAGTDHGRGGLMMVAGGGARGGKVHGAWPGLEDKQLEDERDLRVTTDYRDVLAEVVRDRLGNTNLSSVFPDYVPKPVGVVGRG
jgi:uncharacterized protein (DUF1501 family)